MFKTILTAAAVAVFATGAAQAETLTCTYDKQGATKLRNTYLGKGFVVDTKRKTVVVVDLANAGTTKPILAQVKSNKRFSTYFVHVPLGQLRPRLGFRVYKDGTCQGALREDGYYPVTGRGTLG